MQETGKMKETAPLIKAWEGVIGTAEEVSEAVSAIMSEIKVPRILTPRKLHSLLEL